MFAPVCEVNKCFYELFKSLDAIPYRTNISLYLDSSWLYLLFDSLMSSLRSLLASVRILTLLFSSFKFCSLLSCLYSSLSKSSILCLSSFSEVIFSLCLSVFLIWALRLSFSVFYISSAILNPSTFASSSA
jgi:hypothetical protein